MTDPPYGYSFMGKDWDTFNEIVEPKGAYQNNMGFKKLPRNKAGKGFLEFFTPIYAECLRVLKPGAFAFVMSAPRQDTLGKQIVALQEAGFHTGFTSIYWTYASGFPKALNIGKAVDKKLGLRGREGRDFRASDRNSPAMRPTIKPNEYAPPKLISNEAKSLAGSYGGFQPKPAVEVILVAMKPLSEKTYADQALRNRKGVTWLDDCRIPYESERDVATNGWAKTGADGSAGYNGENAFRIRPISAEEIQERCVIKGRFPANLLVSDDVLNDGRITKSSAFKSATTKGRRNVYKQGEGGFADYTGGGYSDSGSYSRYFDLDKWWARTFPFLIVPKASKREKNRGLERMPEVVKTGLPLRDGSGNYMENEFGDGTKSIRNTKIRNFHPTVKPVKLMAYLITLGSRPGDTVLDPFVGSGTTCVAARMLGRKCVGIEKEREYAEIAKARLKALGRYGG
ncbi:MAG TPA: site-specific DNA-methyltransferase [candidate division Zixibacteria bacterium]|nr:site-specific DNA-methyltransferase [candidate division Zixibacteria bacterium]